MPDGSSSAHLFCPKLIAIFRESYDVRDFRRDLAAALTVAIVALPLSMAFAIASGIAPAHGLYAAIVGGFLVSALGGSRYQIGGPAGAFIVLVSATVAAHCIGGMLLTVLLSGLLLTLLGGVADGFADPLHPAQRDRRFHRRHSRHHPGQPAEGPGRTDIVRPRARAFATQACGAWFGPAVLQPGCAGGRAGRGGRDPERAQAEARMACPVAWGCRHYDRRGADAAAG